MQSYGSLHSPSLHKMEGSRAQYGAGQRRFIFGNLVGDPFFMVSIGIAGIGWLLSFIASIIAQANDNDPLHAFPKYTWWTLIFTLFLNVGVVFAVGANAVQTYHVAIAGYSAAGIVMTTSVTNSLIYSDVESRVAASVGFIFLAITEVIWTLYFGAVPSSTPRAFVDSFALGKEGRPANQQQTMHAYGVGGRPETSTSVQPPQMYTSAQLNGFENSSPVGGISSGPRTSAQQQQQQSPQQQQPPYGPTLPGAKPGDAPPATDTEVVPPTDYPYRAKAIYSYDANADDANEISFSKHEILQVSDVSGRWWQAKKESGETGIAPSNYLILL